MVVNKLGGEIDKDTVKAIILEVDLHVSFHDLSWVIWQDWMGYSEILAIKTCGFFGHFHFGHELIEHVDVVLKLDCDTTDVVLFVDKFGFVHD